MNEQSEHRFDRWRSALKMIATRELAEKLKHLPENDPVRLQAEADYTAAQAVYRGLVEET